MSAFHYINGSWIAHPVPDRGFSFGDGVFETIRIYHGEALFWTMHRGRLEAAMEALALRLPCPWEEVECQINTLSADIPDGRVKLIIARSGEGAYTPPTKDTHLWLIAQPLSETTLYPLGPPQKLILYPYRLLVEAPWSRFKTLSALSYVQAARYAADRGFTDAILLSAEGYVAETTRANLFWFDGEVLHTPPLSTGAVEGILRARVMALSASQGLPLRKTHAVPEILAQAREVFTTNVIQGVAPVRQLTLSGQTYFYAESAVISRLIAGLRKALPLTSAKGK